jgi:enoyl-CoA hydratase/carnithine racemase
LAEESGFGTQLSPLLQGEDASSQPRDAQARVIAPNQLRLNAPKIPAFDIEVLVNPSTAHAALIATFRRAQADAAHKFGLIQTVSKKGPKAIQAAIDAAAQAAKRRDSYAKKLTDLGVRLPD